MTKLLCAIVLAFSAAHAFAQSSTVLGKHADDWQLLLQQENAQDRHLAAWALSQCGPAADHVLLKQLQHPDPVVRYWLIQGIGRNAKVTAANVRQPYLNALQTALNDKSPAPRIAAAEQLARLGAVDAALPVLTAGLNDPQESAGIQAAAALVALGKQAAPARAKLQAAATNGGEYVKRLATRALKNLEE
jgi:hypothetical protein